MTFPTAAAMTTRRSSLMERLGAVIAPPGEPVGKVGPQSLCPNGDLGQHDRARLATNAAYRNAPSGGAPALPSLHDRQDVGTAPGNTYAYSSTITPTTAPSAIECQNTYRKIEPSFPT